MHDWKPLRHVESLSSCDNLAFRWVAKIFFGTVTKAASLAWYVFCWPDLDSLNGNDSKYIHYLNHVGCMKFVTANWRCLVICWHKTYSWTRQNPETNCWANFKSPWMRAISHHHSSPFAWLGQQWPRPARAASHRSSAVLAGVTQVRKSSLFHPYVSSWQMRMIFHWTP